MIGVLTALNRVSEGNYVPSKTSCSAIVLRGIQWFPSRDFKPSGYKRVTALIDLNEVLVCDRRKVVTL